MAGKYRRKWSCAMTIGSGDSLQVGHFLVSEYRVERDVVMFAIKAQILMVIFKMKGFPSERVVLFFDVTVDWV